MLQTKVDLHTNERVGVSGGGGLPAKRQIVEEGEQHSSASRFLASRRRLRNPRIATERLPLRS